MSKEELESREALLLRHLEEVEWLMEMAKSANDTRAWRSYARTRDWVLDALIRVRIQIAECE